MINDNTVAILGWIQFEKVKWLQNNNPEEFGNILEKNMRLVYDSARRQGYELWKI